MTKNHSNIEVVNDQEDQVGQLMGKLPRKMMRGKGRDKGNLDQSK